MGRNDVGEHGFHSVCFTDGIITVGEGALGYEHGVANETARPHCQDGSDSGLELDSSFELCAKNVNHAIVRERLDDGFSNLRR